MPVKSYKDTNNATIFSIIVISFIFGVIFTVDYYEEENQSVKDNLKKNCTIAWSIFGSLSFISIIFNMKWEKHKIQYPPPTVSDPGTDIEIIKYSV